MQAKPKLLDWAISCPASTHTECVLLDAHLRFARQRLRSLWAQSRHQDATPNLLRASLCHRMGLFEAATLLRTAPWLTMMIFVWSILSGLFGGHLPSVHHSEQPITLPPAPNQTFQQLARPEPDTMLSTEVPRIPSHEGRLLRLAGDPFETPATMAASDSFRLDLENAVSRAESLADGRSSLSGNTNLVHHAIAVPSHSNRSDFTQSADLEQHELAMDAAISRKAAIKPRATPAAEAAKSTQTRSAFTRKDAVPELLKHSEDGDHSSGEDMLGMVGLSATPAATANTSHTENHTVPESPKSAANHTHHPHHKSASNHTSSTPAHPTCSIHRNLPIPGTDIAPADKDRCYTHPHIYKNNNYLNDSYYMIYHHDDIATPHPHPAFTWGDITRFARVSHKMRRKKPVTVTFVGGSVSSSFCRDAVVTCWVAPVSAWLKEHNSAVQIINNAVGGTTSRTTAECFDAMVGKDADLIFLEYSYNDRFGIMPSGQQQGYELLIRKLLKLPHKPAVVVVHWWGPKHDCLDLVSSEEAQLRSPDHPLHRCAMTLWNSTEDQIQTLVEHYGVQSISFRNAYWAEIDAELEGFMPDQTLMPDLIHPSRRGVKLLGDLVTRFLSDASAFTARHDHNYKTMSRPLPEALFAAAGLDEQSNTCTRGSALQDMKMHTVDWYWVDGKKPGFQTDVPGASLVLMVMLPEDGKVDKLSLGYLASYENMGWAQVECLGACSCAVLKVDANSTARASQEHFATFGVQRQETGDGCVLKLSTLYQSSAVNGGHRFKVSSVAWSGGSEEPGSSDTSQQGQVPVLSEQTLSLGSD